jgi:hypothetical protein
MFSFVQPVIKIMKIGMKMNFYLQKNKFLTLERIFNVSPLLTISIPVNHWHF